MSLGLASFLLALATFLAGAVTPTIYRRLSHQGISIKPLRLDHRVQRQEADGWIWTTLLKVANATGRSILIDDIQVEIMTVGHLRLRPAATLLADVTGDSHVYVPIEESPERNFDVLPLIVKQDCARVYALQLRLRVDGEAADTSELMQSAPLEPTIKLRINGISRRYTIRRVGSQPAVGYTITVVPGS